jgi:hypothetical protein
MLVVLFLYHRLYQTARRQLEALGNLNLDALEDLTHDREKVTSELCKCIADIEVENDSEPLSESIRNKIHELTLRTLDTDADIKNLLMEELKEKTLGLSAAHSEHE